MYPSNAQARETLGIVAGTELPRRGRCEHYSKSYRWFRYDDPSPVVSMDVSSREIPCALYMRRTLQHWIHSSPRGRAEREGCHDAATDHPNEHANRMIWYVSYPLFSSQNDHIACHHRRSTCTI
ncbi:hypothetical protein LTR95_012767 [Oleoguttula sp. CCFEE 5521]